MIKHTVDVPQFCFVITFAKLFSHSYEEDQNPSVRNSRFKNKSLLRRNKKVYALYEKTEKLKKTTLMKAIMIRWL